jgi:hypothetical protein
MVSDNASQKHECAVPEPQSSGGARVGVPGQRLERMTKDHTAVAATDFPIRGSSATRCRASKAAIVQIWISEIERCALVH